MAQVCWIVLRFYCLARRKIYKTHCVALIKLAHSPCHVTKPNKHKAPKTVGPFARKKTLKTSLTFFQNHISWMNKIQHKLKTEYSTVYLYHRVLTNWCNICPSTTWQRCLFIVHGWCSFCLAFLFQLLQQSTKAGSIVVSSKNCFKCNYAELTDVSEVERLRCNAETRSF